MGSTQPSPPWQPVTPAERYAALDALRGLALLGVLLVNLLGTFRISLAEHILTFHTHPGWADRTVDVLVAALLEFKAFSLFSLCFGIGVAVQAERAAPRGVDLTRFLVRRFLVLLALGLCHLLLIFNGDILALYAVCGLLLLPFLRLPAGALALAGAGALGLTSVLPLGLLWPTEEFLRAHAPRATHAYAQGGFAEVMAYRWREAGQLIAPLLLAALPRTFGLMLLGMAAWRSGLVREPGRHRRLLGAVALGGGALGGTATGLLVFAASSGRPAALPPELLEPCSSVPLALAYAAGLFLWLTPSRAAPFAPAGQMALTNYLAQSLVLGFLFYGYGLGLFGRLGPAPALAMGLALYAAQLAFSRAWLRRYRFGPAEWLWRSLTYGRRQPLRRVDDPAAA